MCLIAAADTRAKRGLRELMAEFYDGYDSFASDYEDPRSAFEYYSFTRYDILSSPEWIGLDNYRRC